jgi:hypothetical protein
MMPDLTSILARAAARHPGPAAARSLAQASAYEQQVIARRHSAEAIPLPEPAVRPGPVRLGPDERWCLRCGETSNTTGYCNRCGSQRVRPAVEILRPDEYYIAN